MKNKGIILLLFISATVLFTSCKKDPVKETESLLVGKDWVEANVGDKDITVLRFNSDGTYEVISLAKCQGDDFCDTRVFDYEGVNYYVEDVTFGQKWLLETENTLKLFSDKDSYITYTISTINKDNLSLTLLDMVTISYKNYGNKVSRLARFKSTSQQ